MRNGTIRPLRILMIGRRSSERRVLEHGGYVRALVPRLAPLEGRRRPGTTVQSGWIDGGLVACWGPLHAHGK